MNKISSNRSFGILFFIVFALIAVWPIFGVGTVRLWAVPFSIIFLVLGLINSKKGLEFFEAHKAADVIHRRECEKLLDGLSKKEQKKAEKAALSTAKYLWNFLSGMLEKHSLKLAA